MTHSTALEDHAITIGKESWHRGPQFSEVTKLLGAATRHQPAERERMIRHYYDDLGISARVNAAGFVDEFEFWIGETHDTASPFRSHISVGGIACKTPPNKDTLDLLYEQKSGARFHSLPSSGDLTLTTGDSVSRNIIEVYSLSGDSSLRDGVLIYRFTSSDSGARPRENSDKNQKGSSLSELFIEETFRMAVRWFWRGGWKWILLAAGSAIIYLKIRSH